MSTPKRKLKILTFKRKIEIIHEVENNPGKLKSEIAKQFGIPKSTLSTVLRDSEKYKKLYSSGQVAASKQRNRKCKFEDIDDALLEWFKVARAANVPVTGTILMEKATEIARKLGKADWQCNEGWLHRFKKRHDIVCKTMSDERNAVDETCTDAWIEDVLKPKISAYSPKDVFNADESGLFWRLLPDKTLAFKYEKCFGGKKSKERFTFLVATNMDGSEKLPLFTIGRAKNPRCFKGIRSPPVKYAANQKAWMTSELFRKWLTEFDETMHSQNRKVLLVLDNCSAHEKTVQPHLKATELLFLAPNATSKLQPVDQGIIKNVKVHYRTAILVRLIAHIDAGMPSGDFQISLIDALTTLKQAWGRVSSRTITNCFRKANFVPLTPSTATSIESDDACDIPQPLRARLFTDFGIDAQEYVNVDDDVQTSDTSIGSCLEEESTEQESDDEEYCDKSTPISRQVLLDCMRQVDQYCMQVFAPGDPVSRALATFTDTLHKHLINVGTQTTIPQFFQKAEQKHNTERGARQPNENGREEADKKPEQDYGHCSRDGCNEEGNQEEKECDRGMTKSASMPDTNGGGSEKNSRPGMKETDVGKSSCIGETGVGEDSYMGETDVGEDSSMGETDVGEDSYMGETDVGEDSYMGETDVGEDSYMGETDVGEDSSMGETEVGEDSSMGQSEMAGDSCMGETEVQITGYEAGKSEEFIPTNHRWRDQQTRLLGLPLSHDLPERQYQTLLRDPLEVNNIDGDGNCLYRALSLEICGTQNYHEDIRAKIIDLMCQHERPFSNYVGRNIGEYLERNTLRPRSWGSDVEVLAAATLLQTTVVVFTTGKWLPYKPLFSIPGRSLYEEKIYLRNVCAHFERVVKIKPQ